MAAKGMKFSDTHEWVKVAKNDEAIIGLTEYAVKQLSDLVHIELPEVGTSIEQGESFGEIESVKAVSDLIAPISGEVIDVNTTVLDNVQIIAEEPYDDGWLIRVKMSNKDELDDLMDEEEYKEYLSAEEGEEEYGEEE